MLYVNLKQVWLKYITQSINPSINKNKPQTNIKEQYQEEIATMTEAMRTWEEYSNKQLVQ